MISTWIRESHDPLVFADEFARVDVRRLANGRMIDGAYLRQVGIGFADPSDAKLVRVRGHPAVRRVARKSGALAVTYAVGDWPVGTTSGEVSFPQWRVVYVFRDDSRNKLDAIVSRLEDHDAAWEALVAAHRTTDEGHLKFGPVPIPGHFRLLREDGDLEELPRSRSNMRAVNFAGSDPIVWMGPKTEFGPKPPMLMYRPVRIGDRVAEPTFVEYVRDREEQVERYSGRRVRTVEARMCHAVFTPGPVGLWRWHTEGNGEIDVRATFVWQDVLGYQWELGYVLPADEHSQLDAVLRAAVAEFV
jgi:hypothetical protein